MLIHLISYFLVNIFECSKRIQYSKTIFELKKIIMQLQIPNQKEVKKNTEEDKTDNKEEVIENAIKESQIDNPDNDEKVTLQSVHNVPQEKEKDKTFLVKKNYTNAYFNKNKKSYLNPNYNNINNSRYEDKQNSNYILEETFHKLSNNSNGHILTSNNSFSSKLSEKLSFNNQTRKSLKHCFSPSKVSLKKQKAKVDIFFNNGVYTSSTGRGKSTASQQSNLSRSNSSNKMYFNSSSKGVKRERKVVLNLIPKVG